MKLIAIAITILTVIIGAGAQTASAYDPKVPDAPNLIVEVLPWMPDEASWQERGDAGIYKFDDGSFTGLAIISVTDTSRPVQLFVEFDDEIITLDCRVTVFEYYRQKAHRTIDGTPVIVEINPEFWGLDLSEVRDTYFQSAEFGKEWISNVHFYPYDVDPNAQVIYIHSYENGWKHWAGVTYDILGAPPVIIDDRII